MNLILLENILNLGNIGDKVKVKDGYGRNFLLKQGKALRFNKENQELVNRKKDELNKKNIEVKNKFKELAKLVNGKIFKLNRECKENGDLYGSIKPKEITNLVKCKSLIPLGFSGSIPSITSLIAVSNLLSKAFRFATVLTSAWTCSASTKLITDRILGVNVVSFSISRSPRNVVS